MFTKHSTFLKPSQKTRIKSCKKNKYFFPCEASKKHFAFCEHRFIFVHPVKNKIKERKKKSENLFMIVLFVQIRKLAEYLYQQLSSYKSKECVVDEKEKKM